MIMCDLYADQSRNGRILQNPVQLSYAGESAAGHSRPLTAACGPSGSSKRPLLSGESPRICLQIIVESRCRSAVF